jgi:hypothetical protein
MIPSDRAERPGLDIASHYQIRRFRILLSLLVFWSIASQSERPLLFLATMALATAGLDVLRACLQRESFNGASLNHWDAAVAFTGVSSFALGLS